MKLGAIVVSHHRKFRQDLAQLVELVDPCVEVIGVVSSTRETLSQIEAFRPGLVLLDLGLSRGDSLDLIGCIHAAWPATAIVVIGNEPVFDYRHLALAAGAIEYVDVLEIATQLPAALQLAEHPADCGAAECNQTQPQLPEAPDMLDQIAMFFARLCTVPTGPKHGPRTAWQYVHICLFLVFVAIFLSLHQNADLGLQRFLIVMLPLVGITIIEARQFIRARYPSDSGWRDDVLKGGAIAET